MEKRKEPSREILGLARSQAGIVAHWQLQDLGAPPGALQRWRRGWVRMARGIHCLTTPVWESWCWAGILHAGDGVIGGSAAGRLHGFVLTEPSVITVWHQHRGPLRDFGDGPVVKFRRGDRDGMGQPRRTGVERTILDLASEMDDDELVMAVTRALAEGRTVPRRVLSAMEGCERLRSRALITQVVTAAGNGVESVLEWRFLQQVVRSHGLPEPVLQPVLEAGTRSDAAWTEFGVVVELDGRLGHSEAFRDMDRDNRLALRGLMTLRYGWHDVAARPCAVAEQILRALGAGGYSGVTGVCGRCRPARSGR